MPRVVVWAGTFALIYPLVFGLMTLVAQVLPH